MAKIKFTGLVSEIRGQLNDVIIQGWKSGVFSVKKMMSAVNNPNSNSQDNARSVMGSASKAWTDALTPNQRATWEAYALLEPNKFTGVPGVRQIIKGNGGVMSGINAFCMVSGLLASSQQVPVLDAPLSATPPAKPTGVAIASAVGVNTVTWTVPGVLEAGAVCRIWIASASGKFHPQIVALEDATSETKAIGTVKGALGHALALAELPGELVYIQMDTVNPSGGKSAGSNTAEVVLTAIP